MLLEGTHCMRPTLSILELLLELLQKLLLKLLLELLLKLLLPCQLTGVTTAPLLDQRHNWCNWVARSQFKDCGRVASHGQTITKRQKQRLA